MSHLGMPGVNGGGGMPIMNNGANGATPRPGNDEDDPDYETRLNTYIYDYFLKSGQYECARSILNGGLSVKTVPKRRDGDVNGADDMHTDSKDDLDSKRPHDLPLADLPPDPQGNSFLLEWFGLFWDVFFAHQRKMPPATAQAMQYVAHTQQQSRMRQQQQENMFRMPGVISGMNQMNEYQQQMMLRHQASGMQMNGGDLRQKALQNNRNYSHANMAINFDHRNQHQQQMMALAKNQQMIQHQMRRDPSEVDMNGQRPRTPSSADNAPSPSKRPRLDSMNGHPMMMQQGRGPSQQMIDHNNMTADQLLLQGGIAPESLSSAQYMSLQQQPPQVQQKSIQLFNQNLRQNQQRSNMPKPGMPGQNSPMMQPGLGMPGVGPEFYNGGMPVRVPNGGAGGAGGNHALQDYQMQLMLLEQQNKKRLLMARQEQDTTMTRPDGQPGMPGAPGGFVPPSMSPQGSRNGPSPGPNDQMKRGTPKMGQAGLPSSPMPDGNMTQARGSPASTMTFGNAMPSEVFQMKNMADGMGTLGPNGQLMRPPPSSHPTFNGPFTPQQIEMQRAQAAGRMNGGNWQSGPQGQQAMIQQPPPAQQPSQVGTPQQRTTMPPPPGVPAGATANGRPGSPAAVPAPPTPSQSNKANPKGKKEAKEKKKQKPPNKKGSTAGAPAATPSSEAENPPPTPTPSTPIIPVHPNSFTGHKSEAPAPPATIVQNATAPAPTVEQPQPDTNPLDFSLDA
ncbi:MAG: hypothetical protein Q9214_004273, partial [Letrouitia sp. 1 TL-2023]